MFYKPKFCANCGEKVERTNWKLWTSRRFCQLCETDFTIQEWLPRAVVFAGLIFVVVGAGGYFQKESARAKITSSRAATGSAAIKRERESAAPPQKISANESMPAAASGAADSMKPAASPSAPATVAQPRAAAKLSAKDEAIYFCGAATKKGTPCSRRVKKAGRCWQHEGQAAILPPEKLSAN